MKVDELFSGAREAISVRRVYGDPIEHDDGNGGGGFGLRARPVGAYVIRDGEVTWKPAIDPSRLTIGWQVVAGLWALALWRLARRRR
jgi:hypothetical protein